MNLDISEIRNKLVEKGLKVTPQRVAIMEAIYSLDNHPAADNIIDYIRQNQPNIATGTVYKVLDTLIENGLVKKVTTDRDIMRYDGITEGHHHLYCSECEVIEDYHDEELDKILNNYFKTRQIDGFKVNEFVVQIKGTFDKC